MSIKSLAVFCGSKNGVNPMFIEHAIQLGNILAEKEVTLVYGGSTKGIMGALANAMLKKKGKVIGVMPKVLIEWEHQHLGLTELHEVTDMHVRKALIYSKCDAALALAGGYGTMDEFFETLTWNQLNIHNKKIFILNSAGFYDDLIAHMKKMEEEKFLYDTVEARMTIIEKPEQLKIYL